MIQNPRDVAFYTGFNYLRPVYWGSVESVDNGFGAQELNSVVPIPDIVVQRPPYINYYLEYPTGVFRPLGKPGDVSVGNDSDNMYFNGFDSGLPFDAVFKVHYVIHERRIT